LARTNYIKDEIAPNFAWGYTVSKATPDSLTFYIIFPKATGSIYNMAVQAIRTGGTEDIIELTADHTSTNFQYKWVKTLEYI
jgi:hypothetical protein